MVEDKLDFPFQMTLPEFGCEAESRDGTVLYLNELLVSDSNSVILKSGSSDELVHLIVQADAHEAGVFSETFTGPTTSGYEGYHYYYFPDEVKVYAEHALVILVAD